MGTDDFFFPFLLYQAGSRKEANGSRRWKVETSFLRGLTRVVAGFRRAENPRACRYTGMEKSLEPREGSYKERTTCGLPSSGEGAAAQ